MNQLPPHHLTSSAFPTLFSSKLIRTTLLLWILFFGNCFSDYGILLLTSQLSIQQTSSTNLYLVVFITSLAELPGILLSAIIVDRLGRKLILLLMFALACFFLFPLASPTSTPPLSPSPCYWELAYLPSPPSLSPVSMLLSCTQRQCVPVGQDSQSAMGRIAGMVCPLEAVGLVAASHQTAAILLFEFVLLLTALSILFSQSETKGQALNDTLSA